MDAVWEPIVDEDTLGTLAEERRQELAAILAEGVYRHLKHRGRLQDGRLLKSGGERADPALKASENAEVREKGVDGRRLDFPAGA